MVYCRLTAPGHGAASGDDGPCGIDTGQRSVGLILLDRGLRVRADGVLVVSKRLVDVAYFKGGPSMEPSKQEQEQAPQPRPEQKKRRFRLVKVEEQRFRLDRLEERIAPTLATSYVQSGPHTQFCVPTLGCHH